MLASPLGISPRRRSPKQPIMKKEKEKGHPMNIASRGRAGNTAKKRAMDGSVERAIGSRLRAYYDEVAREAVPDRFVELLKKLDDESKKH
jgi:hypothetical protein